MPQSTRMRPHGKRKKRRQQVTPMPPKIPTQPVQPQKTRRRWPWLILLIAAIMLISIGIWRITSSSSPTRSATTASSTSLPTATPTPGRIWHTILTVSGNTATKNTQKLKVPADWQLTWSCRGVNGVDGGLYIVIYNANGSLYNAGAQVTCLASKQVIGSVQEQQSGDIYLNINGNDPWTVTIQKP